MSAIYKLSIQGIRSFDSNERETMEFGKPLTLIVGTNGSGKTTIIECLKYATTGDLPPNSKGGAFVHDPKITGEKDVRAQVKLAFTSANGVNMIVTRNIQLLVKKTTNTFKTLEGQLVAINQGERTTLSSRAAELDVQVPLYMGVPKAILDYVIFCHQEDSLWPLSEPANLKKRFDEIFQAMKFTKALDNLKTIRKDMSVDIKLLKQLVEHLKVDRDRSRAAKVNIRSLELKIEEYWDQFNEAGKRLDDITQQSDILFKSNQEFNQVLSKLDSLKHSRTSITEQIKRLQETINPLDLPKHELISLLANFSSSLEEKRTLITEVQDDLKAKQKELETARDGYNHSISRQGELRAKQSAYNENMKIAKELRQQITTEENISGDDIVSQLKNIVDSRTGTLEKILSEHVREQSKLRTQLSELESSRVKEEQHLQYCDTDKEKLMKEIIELEEKLKQTSISQESLEQEKDILTNFQRRLESHRNESEADNVSLQIKDKNNKIVELENDLEKNQQLILKNNEQSDLHAKFSLIKKTFEGKKKELDNHFKELTADENANKWGFSETEDLDLIFKRFYIDLQKKIANETRKFSDSNKEVTEEEFFVSQLTQEKATKAKEITKLTERITKILPEDCAIDDYAEVLEETENSYRTALENLKMHKTTLEFNLKALQVAETNNCCYLCQRKFDNKVEQSNLLKELKSRTDTKFEKTLKDIVDSESDYLSALRRAEKDIILQKDIMRSQIEIDKQIEEGKIRLGKKKENLSKIDRSSTALKKQLEYLENTLRPVIENLIRLKKEVRSLEVDHHATLDELSIYSQTNNEIQTMEELQTKQKQINDHLRKIRKEISELQEEKETKSNEFNKLINKVREKTFRINELERELAEKKNMENTLASRKSDTDNINSIISTATASLNVLKEKISSVNISLESISNQHSMEENKLKENLGKLTRQFEKLHDIELQIELYEQHDVLSLEKCITEIAEKKSSIEALAAEVDVLFKTLNEQTEQLRDSSNEQKNLKLNIDLLDLKTQLHEVDVKMGELDLKNAEAERDKYQQQSLHLRNSFEKLSAENAGRMGEIKQLQNQTESLKRQLDIDYKDIDVQYQKEWVKLQTKTLVTDDIDVYSKALDSAIMKYHSLKMQDINRIIDELWKRTYSGTDVDAIKIKSDEVSSSVRGKSYNYRVVMYKQDAELDMRGRCSAGQKVLASIIIRLALSETFGLNCGVIALDEPTTNLDEENIESLAKSLNNIIEFRRHQKNFQLIVITHDEKFLTHMNASDFADHFYKVKRDDRQKSQIEWVDINRVTE